MCRDKDFKNSGLIKEVSRYRLVINLDGPNNLTKEDSYAMKLFPSMDIAKRILEGISGCYCNYSRVADVVFNDRQPADPLPTLDERLLDEEGNLILYDRE